MTAFEVSVFWRLLLLSLTAIPVTHLCDKLLNLLTQYNIPSSSFPIVGIFLLISVGSAAVFLVRCRASKTTIAASSKKLQSVDPCLYIFSVFAFTSCLDLGIALEIDGFVTSIATQYLIDGEPYLNCAFEALLCYFDGTAMYIMYMIMIYAIVNNKSYRSVALYWVGTLVNSMVVMLFGVFAGKYGLYPSTILNVPYLCVPILVGWRVWHQRPANAGSPTKSVPKICGQLCDICFIIFLVFAIIIAVIRAFAAFGSTIWLLNYYAQTIEPYLLSSDPAPFAKAQMLVYLFYYVPMYLLSIYGLFNRGSCLWLWDVSLIHAGAAANAQFSHIGSTIHYRTPAHFHPPNFTNSQISFWTINLLLAIVPQFLVARNLFSVGSRSKSVTQVGMQSKKMATSVNVTKAQKPKPKPTSPAQKKKNK